MATADFANTHSLHYIPVPFFAGESGNSFTSEHYFSTNQLIYNNL